MNIYFNGRLIVIETDIQWALSYWTKRRQNDDRITWMFTKSARV